MSHFSNYFGDLYQIQHQIWSISKHDTQYEVQSTQRHNHQTFFATLDFLLNHTLIKVVSSIVAVSAFGCSYFVFVPCSSCQAAVTLLLSEAYLFIIRMEDSFDFYVGKELANHLFSLNMR